MITKNIHIEYRDPRTKEEVASYGITRSTDDKADIFINMKRNRKSEDATDTFFHELAHVFLAFYTPQPKMTAAQEERFAQQIGQVCAGVLK